MEKAQGIKLPGIFLVFTFVHFYLMVRTGYHIGERLYFFGFTPLGDYSAVRLFALYLAIAMYYITGLGGIAAAFMKKSWASTLLITSSVIYVTVYAYLHFDECLYWYGPIEINRILNLGVKFYILYFFIIPRSRHKSGR